MRDESSGKSPRDSAQLAKDNIVLKLKGRKTEAPQVPPVAAASAVPPPPMAAPVAAPASPAVVPTVKASKKVPGSVATPPRQRNTAIMAAGAALVLFAGTIAFSVAKSYDDSVQVLVAERSIAEGEPIQEGDFRTVSIAAGSGDIEAVSPDEMLDLVGRRASGPIGEGTLIHPDQFVTGGSEEETMVVGAVLPQSHFPSVGLKAGDMVRLVEVAGNNFSGAFGNDEPAFVTSTDLTIAEVTNVQPDASGRGLHFSFRVPESTANLILDRATSNRLAAALVEASATLDQVMPLEAADPLTPLTNEANGQ